MKKMKKICYLLLILLISISYSNSFANIKHKNWTVTDTIENKIVQRDLKVVHYSGQNVFFAATGILYKYIPEKNKFKIPYSGPDYNEDFTIMGLTSAFNYFITGNTKSGKIITIKDGDVLLGSENTPDSVSLKTRQDFKNKPKGTWNYKNGESMLYFQQSATHNYRSEYLFTNGSPYLCKIKIENEGKDTTLLEYDLTKIPGYKFGYANQASNPIIDYKSNYWLPSFNGLLNIDLENTTDSTLVYKYYSSEDLKISNTENIKTLATNFSGIFLGTTKGKFLLKKHNEENFKEIPIPDEFKPDTVNSPYKGIASIIIVDEEKLYLFWQDYNSFLEFNIKEKKFKKIDFPFELRPNFPHNTERFSIQIYDATYDCKNKVIWFSSIDLGIVSYDLNTSDVTDGNVEVLMPKVYITSIVPNPVNSNNFTANLRCFPDGINNVSAKLYNYLGIEIKDFTSDMFIDENGYCTINYNTQYLPSGLYIFTLKKGNEITSKNVIIYNTK